MITGLVLNTTNENVSVLSRGKVHTITHTMDTRHLYRSGWISFDINTQDGNITNIRKIDGRLASRVDSQNRLLTRVTAAVSQGKENAYIYSDPWCYEFGDLLDRQGLMTAENKVLPDTMYECTAAHIEGSLFELVSVDDEAPDSVQLLINYSPWIQREILLTNVSCGPQSLIEREPVKINKAVTYVGMIARKMSSINEETGARIVNTFVWQRETGYIACAEDAVYIPIGRWVLFNVTFDKRKSRYHTRNVIECDRPSGTLLDLAEPPYKASNIEEVRLKCQCVLKSDKMNNFYTFFENKFVGKITAESSILNEGLSRLGWSSDQLSDKVLTVVVGLPVSRQDSFTLQELRKLSNGDNADLCTTPRNYWRAIHSSD